MNKRAEEAALKAYPYFPTEVNLFGHKTILADGNSHYRGIYIKGYETAEKETIERAIAWLKEHTNKYIVDLTPTYPDAPVNIIVDGMCWEHLKTFLENE